MRKGWIAALALALGLAGARASAIELADGRLSVNGFGQWGYGRTTGENSYFIGNSRGEYNTAQFSIAMTARPAGDVVVAGQFFLRSEGEASLDWGFVEYRLNDLLRVRAGKVKNPFGLFMEVKDVGTLRPFFALPQSIYGPADIGSEAYLGAGMTGEWTGSAGWGVAYDAYGGALEMEVWEPFAATIGATPPFVFSNVTVEKEEVSDVIGGRVSLLTPVDGLLFRVSSYTGKIRDEAGGKEQMTTVGFSAEYALERFQVRGEIFRQNEGAAETNLAGYAEVAWKFLPKLQAALRFERARITRDDLTASSSLRDHTEGAVGLSFWPKPNVAFKVSYHLVDGNRLAVPDVSRDDGTMARRTSLFVAGTQFSF